MYQLQAIILFLWVLVPGITYSQNREETVFRSMGDELQRNMDSLYLQGWEHPFFIQYAVQEGNLYQVQATMGAITGENDFLLGNMSVQTLAGSYQLANINHSSSEYWTGRGDLSPLDNDYDEIRRRLWLLTDQSYKRAIEEYSNKMTSIRQLNLPKDVLELPDFTKLPAVTYSGQSHPVKYKKEYVQKVARDCSAIFKKYPSIYGSNVGIEIYSGNIFSINSEGTRLKHPVELVVMAVNAYTKLEDGETISDRLTFYGLSMDDLPPLNVLTGHVESMAGHITDQAAAQPMDESYTGPIMIRGAALASEFVSELLAARTGLIAYRTPIKSGGVQKLMEDRISRKILSSDITVKCTPFLKKYDGQTLIGSYEVDAEGVTPGKELVLIDNGMLQTLMCDRVPTKKIKTPTGNRLYNYQPQGISSRVSPGVLSITTSSGYKDMELKDKLLDAAKEEGLEYAYMVQCLPNGRSISFYKVYVSDGREELVRSASLSAVGMSQLKRSIGASSTTEMLNMIAGGVPISILYPAAIVLEEVDIEKRNLQNTTKLPIVSNPLE